MKQFFSADYHLGHANIIRYCGRPFKNVEEMNETIIRNHNMRVKPEDSFFHVGDFLFKNSSGGKAGEGLVYNANHYKVMLNGDKTFLKGNHDRNNSLKTCIEKIYISYGGQRVGLVHSPSHVDDSCELWFVGHVHERWKFTKEEKNGKTLYLVNVGVDQWNFMPVTFEEITKELKGWKRNGNQNQVKLSEPQSQP